MATLRLGVAVVCLVASAASAAPAAAQIALGVNTGRAPTVVADLDAYTTKVGTAPRIVMWYQQWSEEVFLTRDADAVVRRSATPLVTWEPALSGQGIPLRDIALGRYDSYITRSARTVTAWGRPVLLRFGHEMNLGSSPWGPGVNGNTAADFVAAWRRVVSLLDRKSTRLNSRH